ncbi:MAG: ABC transporter permease, partial [Flavitalea sp.]
MFKSHLTTILRSLWKRKSYAFLNISGLAIGITFASFIFLWIEDELTFNDVFKNSRDLYKVVENQTSNGSMVSSSTTPGLFAQAVKAEIPAILEAGRMSWGFSQGFRYGAKQVNEPGYYADQAAINMLAFPLLYGNLATVFVQPRSIIISERMSEKIFGNINPIGRILEANGNLGFSADGLFEVTGVFKNLPANSTYFMDWISPYEEFEKVNLWSRNWTSSSIETLIQLRPGVNPEEVNLRIKNFLVSKAGKGAPTCFLYAMKDWNLRGDFIAGRREDGKIRYIQLFTLISLIIILVACINFINLSTARSEEKVREIGIRKVLGSSRANLMIYFVGESMMLSVFSVLLAIILLILLLPAYNMMIGKQLTLSLLSSVHLMGLLFICLFTGLVSGIFPAIYLSSIKPVTALKGFKASPGVSALLFRRGLVILQFSVSIALIICTLVIQRQADYLGTRDIGYTRDRILFVYLQGGLGEHFMKVKNELISSGFVENAATIMSGPVGVYNSTDQMGWPGKDPNSKLFIYFNNVSPEYIST